MVGGCGKSGPQGPGCPEAGSGVGSQCGWGVWGSLGPGRGSSAGRGGPKPKVAIEESVGCWGTRMSGLSDSAEITSFKGEWEINCWKCVAVKESIFVYYEGEVPCPLEVRSDPRREP